MKKRTSAKAVLILACAGLFVWSTVMAEEKSEMTPLQNVPVIEDIEMLKIGDTAPPFVLEDVHGEEFKLANGAGEKVRLLVFWSIFCEPCKAEMPLIQRLYERYREKGLEVLAIDMDGPDRRRSIQTWAKQEGYTFRIFIDELTADESLVVADPYGVAGTPTVYLVGKDGKVALAELGRTPMDVLEQGIEKALAAK
jgi:peroxiredoxin